MRTRIVLLARCLAFACGGVAEGATSEEEALVLYMPFEEGSGDTAYDRSGRNNHGVIHGSATWADRGVVGKALEFDGESFIRLADGDVFGIDDEMTLTTITPIRSGQIAVPWRRRRSTCASGAGGPWRPAAPCTPTSASMAARIQTIFDSIDPWSSAVACTWTR